MPVTINGSSGIDAVQPGVIVQADLAANVAGNGPAFSAYNTVATTCTTSAFTLIALQAEEYDTGGFFDSTTNYRFQPTVAGYYQLNGCVVTSTEATGSLACIFKNGAEGKRGMFVGTGASNGSIVSALVQLNGSTDYVDLRFYQGSGVSKTTGVGSPNVFFQGFLARAA